MKTITILFSTLSLLLFSEGRLKAQAPESGPFTKADTLRGSITQERAWWDVLRYDLSINPDFIRKYTVGCNQITYKVIGETTEKMQIDLQDPLKIDSVLSEQNEKIPFQKQGNVWYLTTGRQKRKSIHKIKIYFSGYPHIAVRPPWQGGWTFSEDSLHRPWMTVCCQGLGASIWYPCKDHQSDEPDLGASLTITVPDTLVGVSNGRLASVSDNHNGTRSYKWEVKSPISTYCLIPYIGKYVNFNEIYKGVKGPLNLSFWVLDYHEQRAKPYFHDQVHKMLNAFEYWFGPYPFYEDSYKLVEVENTGMEHQSGIGYGNHYAYGYRGRDDSHTGYGLKSDFIIVHESAHEWWGNSLTSKDLADMWIHESFANFAEALYTEYHWGKEAGNNYVVGVRQGIKNKSNIVPPFNVNSEGSGDMYPKGSNMLQSIRHSINNDERFREILKGLQKNYYHQTVTGKEIIQYFNKFADFDYTKVFDQYLTTINIPKLILRKEKGYIRYKWDNCLTGFNLPIVVTEQGQNIKIYPTTEWKESRVTEEQNNLLSKENIENLYYVTVITE